ncbi:hypothetical protein EDB84DRAFT_1581894 [Lactarius hengduanensis]|nr:hypothetical protein EDB84DRAFT_1581894 [Lactarius hengduanensis]
MVHDHHNNDNDENNSMMRDDDYDGGNNSDGHVCEHKYLSNSRKPVKPPRTRQTRHLPPYPSPPVPICAGYPYPRSRSSNPRLVLQVTCTDVCLPGDAPHLEGLCSRAVDLLVKDMIWEELEQELDEGRNLDLDSDIGGEDRIIGRIQDFIDENDDILHANDREQRIGSPGPSTTASSRSTSTTNRQFTETPHTSLLTAVPGTSTSLRNSTINWSEESQPRKRLRELERITGTVAVVDPFTPKKRCGKKAHKATRPAAAFVSLETVVGHIRRFV